MRRVARLPPQKKNAANERDDGDASRRTRNGNSGGTRAYYTADHARVRRTDEILHPSRIKARRNNWSSTLGTLPQRNGDAQITAAVAVAAPRELYSSRAARWVRRWSQWPLYATSRARRCAAGSEWTTVSTVHCHGPRRSSLVSGHGKVTHPPCSCRYCMFTCVWLPPDVICALPFRRGKVPAVELQLFLRDFIYARIEDY